MKKIVRLTESDLTRLAKRVIKEMEDEKNDHDDYSLQILNDYMAMMDQICDHYNEEGEVETCIEELDGLLQAAEDDEDLNNDQVDELYNYYDELVQDLRLRQY